MSWQPAEFNPLSFDSLSKSIARELSEGPTCPLGEVRRFEGPGIYVLYYTGDFPAYAPLARANRAHAGSWPIYVGKSDASTRKGTLPAPDDMSGTGLYQRLRNHRNSIKQAANLGVEDFQVHALVLAYVWVPMAKSAAIALWQPLWNTLLDGFGNHDPGGRRAAQLRSRWDTLHAGRPWAEKLTPNPNSAETIASEALAWLEKQETE